MDNLDRTNVVQASLARWTLDRQLRAIGILPATATIDDYDGLSSDFRESKPVSLFLSSGLQDVQYGLIMPTQLQWRMQALAR